MLAAVVLFVCAAFCSCSNISVQDFGPNDLSNILDVIINDGEYIPETTDPDDFVEPSETSETPTEPPTTTKPEQSTTENPANPDGTTDSTDSTEPPTTTEAPTEPPTEEPDDEPVVTVIDIRKVFPGAPEKFWHVDFPESVRMTDSLKRNIKNLADFSTKDFGGEPFYIVTTDATLFTPLYSGGMLSDARRYRTEIVDAQCNIITESVEKPKSVIFDYIKTNILADDTGTGIILCLPFDIQSDLIRNNLVMSLKKVPFLNFKAGYYNASATEAFSINGNILGLVSDMTFDPSTIYSVYYNKSLVKEYNLTDPLSLYKDNKWDYDGMFAIAKEFTSASASLNGEDSEEPGNSAEVLPKWAIGFEWANSDNIISGMFTASGGKYFSQNNNSAGFPVIDFDDNKARGIINAAKKIFLPSSDPESDMNNYLGNAEQQRAAFTGGNVLFSFSKLDMIPDITTSDFDWGLLPVPGLNGENAKFSFADGNAMSVSVPKNSRNTEVGGLMISAMSMTSHEQLKDIYVLEQMTYNLRDVDSVNVLNEIVNNIAFSPYNAYYTIPEIANATGGLLNNAANGKGEFEALYEKSRNSLETFFSSSEIFAGR